MTRRYGNGKAGDEAIKRMWDAVNAVPNGRSVCSCGHRGDGADSEHEAGSIYGAYDGHGKCKVEGCSCTKFSWDHFVAPVSPR